MLGQSFDGFVLLPLTTFESLYGRRKTTTVSVKMPRPGDRRTRDGRRAEGAMRVAHHLRPSEDERLLRRDSGRAHRLLEESDENSFRVIPAIVAIGIVVGGIVIMNIMLMSVSERTHEIGVRKALGAEIARHPRQFLAEAIVLATPAGVPACSSDG